MRAEVDEKNLEVWQWKKMNDDLDKVCAAVICFNQADLNVHSATRCSIMPNTKHPHCHCHCHCHCHDHDHDRDHDSTRCSCRSRYKHPTCRRPMQEITAQCRYF